jgi:hypothetical protein
MNGISFMMTLKLVQFMAHHLIRYGQAADSAQAILYMMML